MPIRTGGPPGALLERADVEANLAFWDLASSATRTACLDVSVPRLFVQLPPSAEPASLPAWLAARGYEPYNHWVKLWRGPEDLPPAPDGVVVEEVTAPVANAFAEICTGAFGFPGNMGSWMAEGVGAPGWHHYLARCDGEPAGVAALFIGSDVGWFSFAGTRQGFRGRGAQRALIARRLRDGVAAGCRWVVTETADDRDGQPSPSCRNMLRAGFRIA